MNDTKPVKKSFPTHRMSWIKFIAQSVQRVFSFIETDTPRGTNILEALETYVRRNGPSGSGFDIGTKLVVDDTTRTRLVFSTEFHHMDENGFYSGWTEHKIVVTPAFDGFNIRVTGRDRNQIKDLIHDTFHHWLTSEADHPALVEYITN